MIKTIERADCKRHQVHGKRDGRRVYVGTYDSKREATAAEEDFRLTQRKIESGELPPSTDTKLGVAVERWLKHLDDTDSRSHAEYKGRVDKHIKPTLEQVPIVNVRKSDVIAWRDKLGLKVSGATVNTIIGTLSSEFTYSSTTTGLQRIPAVA